MGNTIFVGAVLMMTIPISLATAVVSLLSLPNIGISDLKRVVRWWPHLAVWGIWISALSIQSLGLIFTLSRGPWAGAMAAAAVMLGLITVFGGKRAIARFVRLCGINLAVIGTVILDPTFRFGSEDADAESASSATNTPDSKIAAKPQQSAADGPAPDGRNGDGAFLL